MRQSPPHSTGEAASRSCGRFSVQTQPKLIDSIAAASAYSGPPRPLVSSWRGRSGPAARPAASWPGHQEERVLFERYRVLGQTPTALDGRSPLRLSASRPVAGSGRQLTRKFQFGGWRLPRCGRRVAVAVLALTYGASPAWAQDGASAPSIWEAYPGYIALTAAVLVGQFLLIAMLLLQRRDLRQAERTVRAREADVRGSYERIRQLPGR